MSGESDLWVVGTQRATTAVPLAVDPTDLLELLDIVAGLLIEMGTGSPIDSRNPEYRRQRQRLDDGLRRHGIEAPFPYPEGWSWYRAYNSQGMTTYAERRAHVWELAEPARRALEAKRDGAKVEDPGGPESSTWARLEIRVAGVISELSTAAGIDDYQDVGQRCREILIDVARLLADPGILAPGQEAPKAADAKAWLDIYLANRASGRSHRELRAFLPAAWDLAQKVTHGDVDRVDAYAAGQATVLLVRVLQQLQLVS